MKSSGLRKKFLDFFKANGHVIIPGASLIPVNDPTVLFTTAGMHPLVPFLIGEKHPSGKRLADVQKCIRTGDIDSVGDSWHLTFFEMLGNWSLGDYWKKEAINWSFEFLTGRKYLNIPIEKLNITIFAGDSDAPKDEESTAIWQQLGIPDERIYFLPKEDNWWGPAGQTGPCGPCTEIFYDTGKEKCDLSCRPGCSCGKYAEIWNDVFMEFNKTKEGKYEPLKQKNVDTGMGVERTTAVLNGHNNIYETELFLPIIKKIEELAEIKYQSQPLNYRVIADHLKAATFILSENIEPSNIERGYVLRRLIRRAIRHGRKIGIKNVFTFKIVEPVIDIYKDIYPELKKNKDFIEEQLVREEEKFNKTLERGLKEFENIQTSGVISGQDSFNLYQTYGFPIEMTEELAKEKNLEVDLDGFKKELEKHQNLSRTATAGVFKGGMADAGLETTKLHTAAHLMLAGLRKVLGEDVIQKGSNITAERLRFDFSYKEKMTPEQIKKVEDFVNEAIKKDLSVKYEEMTLYRAKEIGAMGVFDSKYGQAVKVYIISEGDEILSREICGGPHVEKTGILGCFKIQKEESSSAGVRRIKAVLE
ncbi:alanine--tRNA ligase [Patescibacteria group bacterium]|nr:alanine--tRNA ligase [Patescibacteria group bacterium]MBU4367902.1 alanine--tRNA ligase [Patescibacteria group bacterium]MBU4461921.1 alanine--tRNA ligase [Patescibacteria group bacterium]